MNIILDAVCEKLWNGVFVGYITAIFTAHQKRSYYYLNFYISSMKYFQTFDEMSNIIIIYEVMKPGISEYLISFLCKENVIEGTKVVCCKLVPAT